MKKLFAGIALFIIYHLLFWQESAGINLTFFSWLSIIYIIVEKKPEFTATQKYLLLLSFLGGCGIIFINSIFTILTFVFTIIATHAALRYPAYSVFEDLANGFLNLFNTKKVIQLSSMFPEYKPVTKGVIYLKIAVVPLLLFFLYIILFSIGNSIFQAMSNTFWVNIFDALQQFSLGKIFFILLGIFIIRWIIREKYLKAISLPASSALLRKRAVKKNRNFKAMALKYEYFAVIILFFLLNMLYAVVNFIDVKWVWFQFYVPQDYDLRGFVHDGVGWLIFTLLLSMSIILYYFRGNLNFYPKRKLIRILAYLWIAQNIILAISVVARTFHYINYHGLAYLRIGVLIFLVMVFFGLITMIYKIRYKRNLSSVLKLNTAFVLGVLVVASLLPWNRIILSTNLHHSNMAQIDVEHYLDLSPHVYPEIYANLDKVERQIKAHSSNRERWVHYTSIVEFRVELDARSSEYLRKRRGYSFASWTLPDARAEKRLSDIFEQ